MAIIIIIKTVNKTHAGTWPMYRDHIVITAIPGDVNISTHWYTTQNDYESL